VINSFDGSNWNMTASNFGLQQVAELASHLSPEEQVQLIFHIQQQLPVSLESAKYVEFEGGSPSEVLRVIHEPPHVSSEAVEELEQAIAAGRLPVRQEGVFDKG
jgi:hypothetical protein